MKKGIFLVEAMVALAVLTVVIGSLMQGVTGGLQGSLAGRQQLQATVLAESVAEEIRAMSASGTWGTDVWVPVADGTHLAADGAWHELTDVTVPPRPLNASFTVRYRATQVTNTDLGSRLEIAFPAIDSPPAPLASKTATGIMASASVSRLSAPNMVDLATDTFWNPGPIKPGSYELTFWREYWRPPHGIHPGYWEIRSFSFYRWYCIYNNAANYPFCWELRCSNNLGGPWTTIDRRTDVYCAPGWNKFEISPVNSPDRTYFRLVVSQYEGTGLTLGEVFLPRPGDPVPGEPYVPASPTYIVGANVHTSSSRRLADGATNHFYNPPKQNPPAGEPYIIEFEASNEITVQQYRLFCTDDWYPTSWQLLSLDGETSTVLHTAATTTWAVDSWATFTVSLQQPTTRLLLIVDTWAGSGLSMGEVDFILAPPPPPPATFTPPVTPFRRHASANADSGTANRLVDNLIGTFWNLGLAPPPLPPTETYLIDLIAPGPFVASQCRMYCASTNSPRNFQLSGRRPAGTWQLLNSWTNETWPLEGWRTFTFPEPAAPASYSTFRLQIDSYNGGGVSIAEFDFPHKYVRTDNPDVFQPGTLLRVEVFVLPTGAGSDAEGSGLQFLVGRRGAEP